MLLTYFTELNNCTPYTAFFATCQHASSNIYHSFEIFHKTVNIPGPIVASLLSP